MLPRRVSNWSTATRVAADLVGTVGTFDVVAQKRIGVLQTDEVSGGAGGRLQLGQYLREVDLDGRERGGDAGLVDRIGL